MIFLVDRVGAASIVVGMWLLSFFLYLSSRRLGFGDADDPHFNFLRPENDVNVCNFKNPFEYLMDLFDSPSTLTGNSKAEIGCYVKERVTAQAWVLWKGCENTLYHVLAAAKARSDEGQRPALKCVVFVDKIGGEPRTTHWGPEQHERLAATLKRAVNEWNAVLSSTEPEFYAGELGLEIACVCEEGEDGVARVYAATDPDLRRTSGYDSFSGLGEMRFDAPYPELLRHGVDISIKFESSDGMSDTYGYVSRYNYFDGGFTHSMCFHQGVAVVINDSMMDGTVSRTAGQVWVDTFVPYALLFGSLALAVLMVRGYAPTLWIVAVACILGASIAHAASYRDLAGVRTSPAARPGHPSRFASDVFPTSLLTHELGHTLLMMDHYIEKYAPDGTELTWSLPGPLRPFRCGDLTPISVMGAETYITALDKAYVRGMWRMLKSRTLAEAIGAETEPDQAGQRLPHTGEASRHIAEVRARGEGECARLDDLPYGFASGGNEEPACKTNGEVAWLYERSAHQGVGGEYSPSSMCEPKTERRVKLDAGRLLQQQVMHNSYLIDFALAAVFTYQLYVLYQNNVAQDMADLEKMANDSGDWGRSERIANGKLKYRALVPNSILRLLWVWVLFSIYKAHEMARCVERESSWINTVYTLSFLLLFPLIPLTLRRTALVERSHNERFGMKRWHVKRGGADGKTKLDRGIFGTRVGLRSEMDAGEGDKQFDRLKRVFDRTGTRRERLMVGKVSDALKESRIQ